MRIACAHRNYTKCRQLNTPQLPAKSKRTANVSISNTLMQKAKSLNINLSATLEAALIEKIASAQSNHWKIENRVSIAAYNEFVQSHGCFGDSQRVF